MVGETIGWAVKQMHNGNRVRRAGWNGKGMWLWMVQANDWSFDFQLDTSKAASELLTSERLPWIAMKTAGGEVVPWLCSQTDLLATDWEIAT